MTPHAQDRTPHRRRAHRTALTLVTAVALAAVAGCAGSPPTPRTGPADAPGKATTALPTGEAASRKPAPAGTVLATVTGQHHLELSLTDAERDSGGFLTVRGHLRNAGDEDISVPAELRGSERDVVRTGQSLAGATLVDHKGRKRYYVLRDSEGRPLTTTGLQYLAAGESVRVFMQFPAPPVSTTQVSFQLPQFDTTVLRISQ